MIVLRALICTPPWFCEPHRYYHHYYDFYVLLSFSRKKTERKIGEPSIWEVIPGNTSKGRGREAHLHPESWNLTLLGTAGGHCRAHTVTPPEGQGGPGHHCWTAAYALTSWAYLSPGLVDSHGQKRKALRWESQVLATSSLPV